MRTRHRQNKPTIEPTIDPTLEPTMEPTQVPVVKSKSQKYTLPKTAKLTPAFHPKGHMNSSSNITSIVFTVVLLIGLLCVFVFFAIYAHHSERAKVDQETLSKAVTSGPEATSMPGPCVMANAYSSKSISAVRRLASLRKQPASAPTPGSPVRLKHIQIRIDREGTNKETQKETGTGTATEVRIPYGNKYEYPPISASSSMQPESPKTPMIDIIL